MKILEILYLKQQKIKAVNGYDNILPGNTIEQDCKEKAINAVHDLLTYHGLMKRKADRYSQEIVDGIEKIITGDENENS